MSSRVRSKNRKSYNFKSSGQKVSTELKQQRDFTYEKLIGIKTPLELGTGRDGLFKMHKSLKDQIKDNFANLLKTNHGDRLGNYYFGANLKELSFELASDDIEQEALSRINEAITRFMPWISVVGFSAFTEHFNNEAVAKIVVRVNYMIPKLNVANETVEVVLGVAG